MKNKLFAVLILMVVISGCATTHVTQRIGEEIRPGMPKDELVELLGPPIRVTDLERKDDRWRESLIYKEKLTRDAGSKILCALSFGLLGGETNIYEFNFEQGELSGIKSQPESVNLNVDTNVNLFQQTEPSQ